jgi:sugar phosphate isomerase/epimerase
MKVSVQLYTVRDAMDKDPKGTLKRLGAMGFKWVELAGTAGLSPIEFRNAMDEAGVRASGMHVGLDAVEAQTDSILADAAAVGTLDLIVPWVPESAYKDGWDKLGRRLNTIGRRYHDAGFRLGYHNHAFEFVDVGGKPGLDVLFENTEPQNVRPQIDLWWALVGGQNPADYIKKYASRYPVLHLKDGKDLKSSKHCGLGEGVQNWPSILAVCKAENIEVGSIELDESDDAMRDVEAGLKYLRSSGFAE